MLNIKVELNVKAFKAEFSSTWTASAFEIVATLLEWSFEIVAAGAFEKMAAHAT